jgi:hypothetical protein
VLKKIKLLRFILNNPNFTNMNKRNILNLKIKLKKIRILFIQRINFLNHKNINKKK